MDWIQENKQTMLTKKRWAVIGANTNEEKFGYKIYQILKFHGYTVWGVNPKIDAIEGEKVYPDLTSLPEKPDCISVVVPPAISLEFVEEAGNLGIQYIWFQPGTYNQEVLEKADSLGINPVYQDCVLVTLQNAEV